MNLAALGSTNFDMLCYAWMGAFLCWLRLEYGLHLKAQIEQLFADIAVHKFGVNDIGTIVAVLLFIAIGGWISIIFVEPGSMKQAVAAGMACTTIIGGVTTPRRSSRRGPAA